MLPEGSTDPRVSIFICGTSIVDMSDDDLNLLLQVFFEDGPPEPFVREYCQVFQRLLIEERAGIRAKEMDELRLAVQGRSNHFFTIWQEGGGPGLN
jgi:hypothetical protein